MILLTGISVIVFCVQADISKAAGPTYIEPYADVITETTWTKANSPYVVKARINVNAKLTIEPGTIVKFSDGAGLNIKSEFQAKGTSYEKIFFTSVHDDSIGGDSDNNGASKLPFAGSWSELYISSPRAVNVEYASISYANLGLSVYSSNGIFNNVTVKNSEIRNNGNGIYIYNTEPVLENNTIANNDYGIKVHAASKVAKAENNSIFENRIGANGYNYSGSGQTVFDAKNNWWGAGSGPQNASNPNGQGNVAEGQIIFYPWLEKDPNHMRRPIIIIPGIGGSVNWDIMLGNALPGNWTLMSHTYDGLIAELEQAGYEKDKSLFICYYDWRKDNDESARNYLKVLIDQAKNINSASKVNIIAHSMGGLVARSYVQSANFQNDVDNLFLIGTPNKGSSDIYPVWEGGYIPSNWESGAPLSAYLRYMNIKKLTFNNYETIHQYIPSVKQLMPIYNYIHPKSEPQNLKNYQAMQEVNTWLRNLNMGSVSLNQRAKVHVVSGNSQPTVNNIPVITVGENPLWADGKPDPIDPERNDIRGDKRVLTPSADITSLNKDTLNFDHGDIVDQAEPIIAQRLSDEADKIYESPAIDNELAFWFASPLDVEIKDPNGKLIKKDNEDSPDKIPLAIYTGESKPDGFKYISIPNPEKGDYEIKLTGNGNGEYHAGSIYVDYKNNIPDQESVAKGTIVNEETKKYKLEYNPNNTEDPVGDIVPSDTTPPTITGYVTTQPDANGWYNTNVSIHFEATDNESGIESVTPDITISTEGENQSVTGTATDNAGNFATFTVAGINIDKTPPDISITSPEPIIYLNDRILPIIYEITDNFSAKDKITFTTTSCSENICNENFSAQSLDLSLESLGDHIFRTNATDQAGNTSEKIASFKITTNLDAIRDNTNYYWSLNLIKKKCAKKYLEKQTKQLEKLFAMLDKFQNSSLKPKPKQTATQNIKQSINQRIGQITKKIAKNTPKYFDEKAAELLIEDLNFIRP